MHTSHSIGSIFSLYNRFAVCIEPVPKLPLQLFGDKLRLTKVVIPGVITVAENYITELYLEDDGRDQRCKLKLQIRLNIRLLFYVPLVSCVLFDALVQKFVARVLHLKKGGCRKTGQSSFADL